MRSVWCAEEKLRDDSGTGRAFILAAFLAEHGEDVEVLRGPKPHPFAVHAMLEMGVDMVDFRVVDEPSGAVVAIGSGCPWDHKEVTCSDPFDEFDGGYNEERMHAFRRVRDELLEVARLLTQI